MTTDTITIPVDKLGKYFATLPLEAIKVGARHRKEHGDIGALADSIKEIGLLQPIVVDLQHNLICGHRRLLAHRNYSGCTCLTSS